jgi:hypothetical protein
MQVQTVAVDVVVKLPPGFGDATQLGSTWSARWPEAWADLQAVVAAINAIGPDGSSPSHNDRLTVLSGRHPRNVTGELYTMGGLEQDQELTYRVVAVGYGELASRA